MKSEVVLYPRVRRLLVKAGEQIHLARLRRHMSASLAASRAKISRSTLWKIERGDPSVCMGAYLSVLFVMGLENDILALAGEDRYGHEIADMELLNG